MNKTLIITDSDNLNNVCEIFDLKKDSEYYLHAINISADSIIKNIHKHKNYKNIIIKSIGNIKINQLAENEARDHYLKLIKELPKKKILNNKSFAEILTIENINYWWYFPISEKNIWTDKTIHRLYEICRLNHIISENIYVKICFCMTDKVLEESFAQIAISKKINFTKVKYYSISHRYISIIRFCANYYFNALKAFCSVLFKKILFVIFRTSANKTIINNSVGIFSYFPLYWNDLNSNNPKNYFFAKLPCEISKSSSVSHILWLAPWMNMTIYNKYLKQNGINNEIILLEKMLKINDVLSLFKFDIFLILLSIIINKKSLITFKIDSVRIGSIVYDELYRSFSSSLYFNAILIDRALRRISLNKLKILLFRLEFQPHERAILYNTKGIVKSVGFQHSALSKNFLNYVFKKGELGGHWLKRGEVESMPLPDCIFTSGKVGYDYMCRAGYPEVNLFICGAIRYYELRKNIHLMPSKDELREQNNISSNKKIIFVVTTPIINETVSMLTSLYQAISINNHDYDEYYIIIKHHPNAGLIKDYRRDINEIIKPWYKEIAHEIIWGSINIHEYIKMSNAILTSGGTLPLEAMIIGVPSILYSSKNNFSHNPLENYPQSVLFVEDIKSMYDAIKLVVKNEFTQGFRDSWNEPVRNMFGVYHNNQYKKIIKLLESL